MSKGTIVERVELVSTPAYTPRAPRAPKARPVKAKGNKFITNHAPTLILTVATIVVLLAFLSVFFISRVFKR